MSKAYPILQVDDVQPVIDKSTLGLVPLERKASSSLIESTLNTIADGTPPPVPEWTDTYAEHAIAISYVHADPSQWYGRISRGKFSSHTKQRLVHDLQSRNVQAFWLDQCLAQRRGDGEAGWAVLGLLPYAVMPVLVIGNFSSLRSILASYVELERLPEDVLSCVMSELEPLLQGAWSTPSSSDRVERDYDGQFLDFVEMSRFWPMMERALAHKAKGLFYEQHTFDGLIAWGRMLSAAKQQLDYSDQNEQLPSGSSQSIRIIIGDLLDMVQYSPIHEDDSRHFKGLDHNVLSALSIVTSALGSGALTNAKLYQPQDRNALLLAGMCFNLFANSPSLRTLRSRDIVQIVEDPYRAFGVVSERIPATYHCTANALAGANGLYNRPALESPSVAHVGVADEVTIYSEETAQFPTSRRWNGQWELIPHLSLCMRAQLIDIGERSMNSEPYDDFVMLQCFSDIDITGKPVQAALCGAPLTEKHSSIPLIAVSLFSVNWTLRPVEREIFEKHDLRGWTSRVLFLGMCDTIRKKLSIEAMVVCHMTILEEDDQLLQGRIARSSALKWLKMLIRRTSCPLHKRTWVLRWISTNFDNINYTWYCGVRINLHRFTWEKWVTGAAPVSGDATVSQNSIGTVRFVKISRVSVETLATCPQLPLNDVIRFIQAAMLLSAQKSITNDDSMQNIRQRFIHRVFETWLGLLTGLHRAYELQNGIASSAQLRLLLPGYKSADEIVELSSEEILESGSGFVEGLARTMSAVSELTVENGHSCLQWDMRSSRTFWELKEIVFSTAHAKGMMLTLMLICLTTAASASSTVVDSEAEEELTAQGTENALDYQIHHAIRKMSKSFSSSRGTQDVIYVLVEHVIRNTRLPVDQIDWRISPEGRTAVQETITGSGSEESVALMTQADTVFQSLREIHATMCHVRKAKIDLDPGQSFVDATEASFKSMIQIPEPDERDTEQVIRDHSTVEAAARDEDIREVIPTHDVAVDPTTEQESRQKRLVVTLEFVKRQ